MTKSRGMRQEEHVAHMGEMRNAFTVLIWKHEGKRQLERPRHGVGGCQQDSSGSGQATVAGSCEHTCI
jgi:hypothetical protein